MLELSIMLTVPELEFKILPVTLESPLMLIIPDSELIILPLIVESFSIVKLACLATEISPSMLILSRIFNSPESLIRMLPLKFVPF